MEVIRKYWYIGFVLLVTAVIGVASLLTSQKLTQTDPVAPNVPQEQPQAASAACTVNFVMAPTGTPVPSLTSTPAPGCGETCSTSTGQCPTDHTCSSGRCVLTQCLQSSVECSENNCTVLPTPTPTSTPLPTATTPPGQPTNTPAPTNPPAPTNTPRPTNTPTIAPTVGPSPTPPVPQVPVAGTGPSVLGMSVIIGGALLLLLGLAF